VKDYLPFIIIGLTTGSVYGLAAIGLVLTYKTSGLFNFGHGAIAAAAAVLFYELRVERGVPWPIAVVLAVGGFGILAGLLMERLAAGLQGVATSYRIVATVGLILAVPAVVSLIYGPTARSFPSFLPAAVAFRISGVRVGWDAVITATIGLGSAAFLYLFLQKSRIGKSMRAVVDRPELLDLTGESPAHVRRLAWLIGCSFAAVSGVLLANTQQQMDVTFLSLLVVQAFGAAAVGAFTSLPMAYGGGLALGVFAAVIGRLSSDYSALRGLDFNMPFIFLFVGLLVIPKGRLIELGQQTFVRRVVEPIAIPQRVRLAGRVAAIAFLLLVPQIVGIRLSTWNTSMAQLLLFLSLGLLVHTSGQISLCQVGFAAVGATTFAHFLHAGLPWGLAVLGAGVVLIPVGALIAVPAIRLSGLYLGLATLGFGILLAQFFYSKSFMFGPLAQLSVSRPTVFGLETDKGYYYVLLAFGAVGIGIVKLIERSRLGRILGALADSPTALSTLGANTNIPRVMVFCASAFLAGISGALSAGLFASITPDGYVYVKSLLVLSALMICGQRTVSAALLATLAFSLPSGYLGGEHVGEYTQLAFGAVAVILGVLSSGRARTFAGRFVDRMEGPAGDRLVRVRLHRPASQVTS
jgi:branched-subunit amino acid ABC-type transport system permease component